MRKLLLITALLTLTILVFMPEIAAARASHASHSSKSSSSFMVKTCKTKSCYKKHPDGRYAIPLNGRRKKG